MTLVFLVAVPGEPPSRYRCSVAQQNESLGHWMSHFLHTRTKRPEKGLTGRVVVFYTTISRLPDAHRELNDEQNSFFHPVEEFGATRVSLAALMTTSLHSWGEESLQGFRTQLTRKITKSIQKLILNKNLNPEMYSFASVMRLHLSFVNSRWRGNMATAIVLCMFIWRISEVTTLARWYDRNTHDTRKCKSDNDLIWPEVNRASDKRFVLWRHLLFEFSVGSFFWRPHNTLGIGHHVFETTDISERL